jgi:hypothetical protein
MLFYPKKQIHRWSYWHTKNKMWFIALNGLIFSFIMILILIGFEIHLGHFLSFLRTLAAAGVMFVVGFILGIVAWDDNEEAYERWLKEKSKQEQHSR